MNNKTVMVSVIAALAIGAGGGFAVATGVSTTDVKDSKEMQAAISMMNTQSASITQMSELMKVGGTMMQEMGIKYRDSGPVQQGKDMQVIAERHMRTYESLSDEEGMRQMMGR